MLYCMSIRCILNAAIPKKKPAKGNEKIFVTDNVQNSNCSLLDAAMATTSHALSQCDSRCSFMTNLCFACLAIIGKFHPDGD